MNKKIVFVIVLVMISILVFVDDFNLEAVKVESYGLTPVLIAPTLRITGTNPTDVPYLKTYSSDSAVIENNEHISCDGWATCYEGEICVHDPEVLWADGLGKGNWVCLDKKTYPYDLVLCPHDPLQMCAVEKRK